MLIGYYTTTFFNNVYYFFEIQIEFVTIYFFLLPATLAIINKTNSKTNTPTPTNISYKKLTTCVSPLLLIAKRTPSKQRSLATYQRKPNIFTNTMMINTGAT